MLHIKTCGSAFHFVPVGCGEAPKLVQGKKTMRINITAAKRGAVQAPVLALKTDKAVAQRGSVRE
jgi:hypothetical protein